MADAELDPTENVDDDDNDNEASRHRRERRELQTKIQQMKKSVNKNDKTRKKKVDAEIKALEDAFAKQWEHFNENAPATTEEKSSETEHVSRKARRQANKDKRQADFNANQEVIDYDNLPEAIRQRDESASIDEQLNRRGLELRSIPSDGNCLFASLVDQSSGFSIRQLRQLIADYLREHRNEFEPFIETDYDLYCEKLAKENIWGGQVELQISAKILHRSIEIIQGNGDEPIRIPYPSLSEPPIVITYHRYLYTNGEHYNSTKEKEERE